jgi:hypothetical protein
MRLHIGNIHTGLWLPLLDLTTCMRNNDCWHSSPVPLLQDYAEKKHCGKNWNTIKPFFFHYISPSLVSFLNNYPRSTRYS